MTTSKKLGPKRADHKKGARHTREHQATPTSDQPSEAPPPAKSRGISLLQLGFSEMS